MITSSAPTVCTFRVLSVRLFEVDPVIVRLAAPFIPAAIAPPPVTVIVSLSGELFAKETEVDGPNVLVILGSVGRARN